MAYQLEILPRDENDPKKKERQTVENPKGAIILVHGICHGAWCWENFINFFADHGIQCYAISLPGHGGSGEKEHLQEYCLSNYVEAVKEAMQTIKDDMAAHGLADVKPFILGHSMGGAVVQQYIGKYEEDVQGAILFASATAPHMTRLDTLPKNRKLWYATFVAWGWCDKPWIFWANRKQIHNAAFFSSRTKDGKIVQRVKDTSRFELLLQEESKKVIGGKLALLIPGDLAKRYSKSYNVHIPVFVIGSDADLYFGEDSLRKTAHEYFKNDSETALVVLKDLCHDMMLDDEKWAESAKPVLKFIEDSDQFLKENKYSPS